MPTTQHELHHPVKTPDHPNNATTKAIRHLVFATCLLTTIVVFLILSALAPHEPGNLTALAADASESGPEQTPRRDPTECLENVAWPDAFEIPFTAWVLLSSKAENNENKYVAWRGNKLQYQYDEQTDTVYFRSRFPKCVNLPGVPLSFFGKPCEFLFPRDPQNNNQYDAYVYSSAEQKYFLLAKNLGPQAQDFVARYQKLLPSCRSKPFAKSHLPVGNPPGVPVDWFVTAGHKKVGPVKRKLPPPSLMGYYAAIAKPTPGPEGQLYKPPYSFAGSVPGIHKPSSPTRMVAGQLIYDWQKFSIVTSFRSETFAPPTDYVEIKGCEWKLPPMICPTCHLTDPASRTTFYIEARRNPKACATPRSR